MYHSVDDTGPAALGPYRLTPSAFRDQLAYLRAAGFQSMPLRAVADHIREGCPWPHRAIVITFDDGYRNFYEHAWPTLEAHGFSATMFVVTGKVGGRADWDHTGEAPLPLMGWDELRDLQCRGLEIGSHTAYHPDLPTLPREAVVAEARLARATLMAELGIDATAIAYPYGRVNDAVRDALRAAGCRIGLETWGGLCSLGHDMMRLPRIEVFPDDDLASFAGKLGAAPANANAAAATRSPPGRRPPTSGSAAELARAPIPPITEADQNRMAVEPRKDRQMAARLDRLVGDFIQLHAELNASAAPSDSLHARITKLFCMKVTGQQRHPVAPYNQLVEGIQVGFDRDAHVQVGIEPKRDHGVSPSECLNTLEIDYDGPSTFLTLELACTWEDIAAAQRFQVGLYAEVSRPATVRLVLRLAARDAPDIDVELASLPLRPGTMAAHRSADFTLPDIVGIDVQYKPRMLFFFDSQTPLRVRLNYLALYFA